MISKYIAAILVSFLAFAPRVQAAEPVPIDTSRWKPITDDVYLQEVGSQVLNDEPLLAVAVLGEEVYVAGESGVYRLDEGSLVKSEGPTGRVSQLKSLQGALWGIAEDGLWHLSAGAWTRVSTEEHVDVSIHLGEIVVASPLSVAVWRKGSLQPLNTAPPVAPILGLSSYSETIYVRHAHSVAFLHDGRFEYDDVKDWGQLPLGSETRGILSQGNRLLVPTNRGLAALYGMSWRVLTGADGLCYEDTTCVAEGSADDLWIGTTKGAIRSVESEYHYFGADRWIPDDQVNAIACGKNAVYIATDDGLGIIEFEPYTLQKKSAWYKREMEEMGMKRLGFVNTLVREPDGTYTRYLSDNDVGWACHYLDALCFEYAITKDPDVRAEAVDVFKSIKWSEEISPIRGFPARAIYAVGEPSHKDQFGSAGRPAEWNRTPDNIWEWKGDTSSDEIIQQFYSVSIFFDLVAEGIEKEAAIEHIDRMMTHIIDSGWCLRDLDGKPTVWARWEPEFIYGPEHTDERGLNSLQAFTLVSVAEHMVGGDKYKQARQQLFDWGYAENILRQKKVFPGFTHFDDRLAFLTYFPLLRYESDPRFRSMVQRSLQRSWEIKRVDNQAWFDYVYGAITGNDFDNDRALRHLQEYPLSCIDHRFTNSHRQDLQVPTGYRNYLTDWKAMGPREQGVRRWDRDPLELDGGGSQAVLDPSSFLDAYWMARYFGFIEAPKIDDPDLLTVEKRNLQRGAVPYNGPPRPHIF